MELYLLNIKGLPDPAVREDWKLFFPEGKYDKILRLAKEEDRKQQAGAWLLLYYALKECGVKDLPGEYYFGPNGKPLRDDIFFNLSHSGSYALCVTAKQEVGCDVEMLRPVSYKIVRRFFSEKERRLLEKAEGPEADRLYTTLWTLRESYAKKTGEGLAAVMDHLCFASDAMRNGQLLLERFHIISRKDCQIAVCSVKTDEGLEIRTVDNSFRKEYNF